MAYRIRAPAWPQVPPRAFRRALSWQTTLHLPVSRRWLSLIGATVSALLLVLLAWQNQDRVRKALSPTRHPSARPLCRHLPGAKDVLVVMKTGANEIEHKLGVHLRTTLTCYPNHVVFSDYEETLVTGEQVFDAFTYTSPSIKEAHEDFALWRKLRAGGRSVLPSEQLSGPDSREKPENVRQKTPGWQLDKWKFLPMMNQTFHLHPDKHCYVFLEADTYMFWSNLLRYVATRSWTNDVYIGSRAVIEEVGFAHGGSGFLLSSSALQKVVVLFNDKKEQWEDFNRRYWVGDHVLAVALQEAGVVLQDGNPSWQGQVASFLDIRPNGGLWCTTVMTSHHQLVSEIEDLWNFEQAIISRTAGLPSVHQSSPILYRHILEHYVLPRIALPRSNWDNKADQARHFDVTSLHECQILCKEDETCMHYALHEGTKCMTTLRVIFGEASRGVESGWTFQRIRKNIERSRVCPDEP